MGHIRVHRGYSSYKVSTHVFVRLYVKALYDLYVALGLISLCGSSLKARPTGLSTAVKLRRGRHSKCNQGIDQAKDGQRTTT